MAGLTGAAQRHAGWRELSEPETAEALAELREIAAGRGDLLAETAGTLLGFYEGELGEPRAKIAARLCVQAGADPGLIPRWIEEGRRRAAIARMIPHRGQPPGYRRPAR